MDEQVIFRSFQKQDRTALEDCIREAWRYDEFCSAKTARRLSKVYLNSCLINQTYTQVAVVNGMPAGVIMGKNVTAHRCPPGLWVRWLFSLLSLLIRKEGREVSKTFAAVERIDKELLDGTKKEYPGEVAFFAIKAQYRGKGLGKQLFSHLLEYMKSENIREFYLFTDTSCNYPFYEHQGMTRCCQKKHPFFIKGWKSDMTFFLYEYRF